MHTKDTGFKKTMKSPWLTSVLPIAALFAFRMLGLFMLIPVFTIYATQLQAATPTLIGIALGSYGLSQGLLQIPFGMLSDRYGRKPIIMIGLILFACGSLLGAFSTSIYTMIIARILQGMGAIGSVLIALLADLTNDKQRTKAMAVIGMTIGLSFSLAMVISPSLTYYFGLSGIFYLTTVLAICGLLLLYVVIPTPPKDVFSSKSPVSAAMFKQVLSNPHLQRLNIGIFCQHFILTATFFSVPMLLQQQHLSQQWHFYLPLMIGSFLLMIPFIILGEKKRQLKTVFLGSVLAMGLCQFALAYLSSEWRALSSLLFIYFIGFNILEASLPSLISKQASPSSKGCAMGIYSSNQFLGIFAGGSMAGVLYQYAGSQAIFMVNGAIALFWLAISFYIQPYAYQLTLPFSYDQNAQDPSHLAIKLKQLAGVIDVVITQEERMISVRIDRSAYTEGSIENMLELTV